MTEYNKPFEGQELQTSSSFASNQNPPPSSYINYPQAQPYPQQIYSYYTPRIEYCKEFKTNISINLEFKTILKGVETRMQNA